MGSDPESGAGPGGAEQDETSLAVVGIVLFGVGLIYLAIIVQASRAGQAVSLMTEGGQDYARLESGIPDVIVAAYLDGARLVIV